jgi:hypothetical protein
MGLSGQKRDWAERIGVDPYTTNPFVQSRLERNGWLSLAGDMTVSLATIAIPAGGASIALSVVGSTSGMSEALEDVAPEDIRVTTRSFLGNELGVKGELAERFLKHPWYSPSRQDTIIRSLARMQGVAYRDEIIAAAVRADEPHEAYAFTRLALMFAEFHEEHTPIVEIFTADGMLMAHTEDGYAVLPLYMDYGYWTQEVAEAATEIDRSLGWDREIAGKYLLVSGQMTSRATRELELRGWRVIPGVEELWLTELDLAAYEPEAPDEGRYIPQLGR